MVGSAEGAARGALAEEGLALLVESGILGGQETGVVVVAHDTGQALQASRHNKVSPIQEKGRELRRHF